MEVFTSLLGKSTHTITITDSRIQMMWSWSCMETIPKENRISPLPFLFILLYSLPLLPFTLPQENGGQILAHSFSPFKRERERDYRHIHIHWDKAEVCVRERKLKKKQTKKE